MKATAKDLRFNTKEILNAVERGEEIVITYRGTPQAKIVPIQPQEKSDNNDTPLFGIWRDHDEITDVDGYIRTVRKGRFDAD